MKRWVWKRWVWTGVFGITAAVGLALGAGKDAQPAPPRVGDVITLKFEKGSEKQVKIIKTERQSDGSYQSEVKDMKSGEVFTLIDKSHMPPETPKAAKTGAKAPMASPAPKTTTASLPPAASNSSKMPMTPKAISAKSADEPVAARMSSPSALPKMTPPAPAKPNTVAAPTPMPEPMAEPQKKPGLLKRLFGKDSTPPAMPAPTPPAMPITSARPVTPPTLTPAPAAAPSTSVFESGSPAKPSTKPRIFSPTTSVFEGAAPKTGAGTAAVSAPKFVPDRSTGEPPRGRTIEPNLGSALLPPMERTSEPPRTLPMNSVAPPKPVIPVPVTPPSNPPTAAPSPLPIPSAPATIPAPVVTKPSTTIPSVPVVPMTPPPAATPVLPAPSIPAPVVPAVPTAPALPTIPAVPDGMSMNRSMVMQAGMKSPVAAMAADIQPHVTSLRTAVAPSVRAMAARALSGGRHASSDTVKEVLFIACTTDPSPFVRACCIEELSKLGYFDPAFMAHLHKACADQSEEVRMAAKEALKKMTPAK
jgi:HEAT repeat protein